MNLLTEILQLEAVEQRKIDVLYFCMILKPLRLRLRRIDEELREVQRHFSSINAALKLRRDDFTDAVRLNMLAAYEFLDAVLHDGVDMFSDDGLEALLRLNHLVLLGPDYDSRAFSRQIRARFKRSDCQAETR